MIQSFCDDRTQDIYDDKRIRRLDAQIIRRGRRRLELLNAAKRLEDMYFPPSNRFHALEGHIPTRYAIWVNAQYRITFEWRNDDAFDVCFEDYH